MSNPANLRNRWKRGWGAAAAAALLLAVALPSLGHEEKGAGRVPAPHVDEGKGGKCVRDTEFMRRNHMNLLKHQRDETVHKGIRTTQYSLKNCIECHASQKNNSVVGTNENFCQGCHSYVGVKLDCFECHATKPKEKAAAFHPLAADGGAGLAGKMRWQTQASAAEGTTAEGVK
jgi:hypothetical protein